LVTLFIPSRFTGDYLYCTVLGHCLENGEIKPSQKHIEKILQIHPQTTKKGVGALLGLVNYHSDMIPNLADITYCLTELLKRDQPDKNINWQPKHTVALEQWCIAKNRGGYTPFLPQNQR
jgi:hypothetical protein